MLVSGVSQSFSPISELLADTYEVPILEVNFAGMVFTIMEVPLSIVCMFCFSKMGAGLVLKIGTFMFLAGAWVRQPIMFEGSDCFLWLLFGQTLLAMS